MFYTRKPYSSYSDEQLIPKIIAGESLAFTELYKRYNTRVLYYFYRMLGNSNDKAQDFLQDIFIKLIDKVGSFDHSRKFSTWFFSIAYNMCKNEYRRTEVRKEAPIEQFTDYLYEADNDFDWEEAEIDPEDFNRDLFAELENFDEIHKTVFLLHYREGFSLKEIGQALDISEGTVKSRLFYTRKRLSEKLSKYKTNIESIKY
jgi:RNA polymerase sigma-70 factor (ECF subfamily)